MIKKLLLVAALAVSSTAMADTWPSKPIRIIVPYAPGGASDMVARRVGAQLSLQLKTPVIVENRPGADNAIGTEHVAKSPPDGYTLMITGTPTYSAQVHLFKNQPFDIVKDLTRVNNLLEYPSAFTVHPSVPVNNVQEFIAYAKANPGKLSYGTAGASNHLSLGPAMFRSKTGVVANDIPYKGSGQAVIDLLGGNIQFMFDTVSVPLPHIRSGKLRVLATTGDKRSPVLPEVPTLREQGVDMSMSAMMGIMGPANMPKEVVRRLNAELSKAMAAPEMRSAFTHLGMEVKTFDTPEAFEAYFLKDVEIMGNLVRSAGITAK